MLQFYGGRALSPFRLEKLLKEINTLNLQVSSIHTEYWHFCSVTRNLQNEELGALKELLDYDFTQGNTRHTGEFFLVLPRPGTISPWSTKATDIAHHCGLTAVERIERGIAFYIQCQPKLSAEDKVRLASLIHDRMTEAVFDSFEDAAKLFQHFEPKPLNTVDVMKGGIEALLRANQTMGLALSTDEIEYLLHHFEQIARNPTDVELMMFAQTNSEHCRHKIFNADWIVDGKSQDKSLFAMIRNTHLTHPHGTLVA
nr:phosphoribosylformylglycinamidine synthase [Nitrosomonas sp.]